MIVPPMDKPTNEGFVLGIRTPPAERYRQLWAPGRRIADASTMFGPYIDVLTDIDFALQKDPFAHDKMMRDCQVRSCIRLRQLNTAARKIQFLPRDNSLLDVGAKEAARFATEKWDKVRRPTEVILNILDAVAKGVSFQEVVWRPDKSDFSWYSENIFPVHKDRFRFTLDGEMVMVTPQDVFYGQTLPPRVFIHHVYDPEPATFHKPETEIRLHMGHGEFDRIYPWFLWKQLVMRLGFAYLDRLAFPIKVGRYPQREEGVKADMLRYLKDLDHHRVVMWPGPESEGWGLDFIQTQATGHNVAMDWVNYIDMQIAKVILGSTLMQQPGERGSFALGAVHTQSVFGSLAEFDSLSLCDTLEHTWVRWLCELNNIPLNLAPKVVQSTGKSVDVAQIVDIMLLLCDKGFPVSIEQVAEVTGVRPAREGETLLTMNVATGESQLQHGPGSPFSNAETPDDLLKPQDTTGKRPVLSRQLSTLSKDRGITQKGSFRRTPTRLFQELAIVVENPAGTERYGVDRRGKQWRTKFLYDYGYIVNTRGEDNEGVDVYIGPDESSEVAFIIHQNNPTTGKYDEDKVMLGFESEKDARSAYFAHYDDPGFFGGCSRTPMSKFDDWLSENAKVKGKYKARELHALDIFLFPEQSIGESEVERHALTPAQFRMRAEKERVTRSVGPIKEKRIERSAKQFRKIEFDYTNLRGQEKHYVVEPYSYRYRRGYVYLYAFDVNDRSIKSFFTHKLRNVQTAGKFRPRWVVEIGEAA